MNYKTEIARLSSSSYSCLNAGDNVVIKAPIDRNKPGASQNYYLLDPKQVIGEGNFGRVYKIRLLKKDGSVDTSKFYALKAIAPKNYSAHESEIFRAYYYSEQPILLSNDVFLITEYFPGVDLFDNQDELHPSLRNLTLDQSLRLIQEIAHALNLLHHNTPQTGSAIIHCDLKGPNIKVDLDPKGSINVYVMDFGLSSKAVDDPSKVLDLESGGSPLYLPPEVLSSKRGIKSDIYALVPIILRILKARDPFQHKLQFQDIGASINAPYCYTDFLKAFTPELAKLSAPFKTLIEQFLRRMEARNYDIRPNTDEVLKFFTVLHNYYKLARLTQAAQEQSLRTTSYTDYETHKKFIADSEATLTSFHAVLALIASNQWQARFFNFQFGDHSEFCTLVVAKYAQGNLSEVTVNNLYKMADQIATQKELVSANLKGLIKILPPCVFRHLENYRQAEPIITANLLGIISRLESSRLQTLESLLHLVEKSGAELSLEDFQSLVNTGNKLQPIIALKACIDKQLKIEQFTQDRRPSVASSSSSAFFGRKASNVQPLCLQLLAKLEDIESLKCITDTIPQDCSLKAIMKSYLSIVEPKRSLFSFLAP